mmetsp:Transcript_50532/g.99815  ORF Transcript_50532/g.99815 Transcript_50532/m.99815 type:complete len:272 (+) Transcript_50532:693-1508(+)
MATFGEALPPARTWPHPDLRRHDHQADDGEAPINPDLHPRLRELDDCGPGHSQDPPRERLHEEQAHAPIHCEEDDGEDAAGDRVARCGRARLGEAFGRLHALGQQNMQAAEKRFDLRDGRLPAHGEQLKQNEGADAHSKPDVDSAATRRFWSPAGRNGRRILVVGSHVLHGLSLVHQLHRHLQDQEEPIELQNQQNDEDEPAAESRNASITDSAIVWDVVPTLNPTRPHDVAVHDDAGDEEGHGEKLEPAVREALPTVAFLHLRHVLADLR